MVPPTFRLCLLPVPSVKSTNTLDLHRRVLCLFSRYFSIQSSYNQDSPWWAAFSKALHYSNSLEQTEIHIYLKTWFFCDMLCSWLWEHNEFSTKLCDIAPRLYLFMFVSIYVSIIICLSVYKINEKLWLCVHSSLLLTWHSLTPIKFNAL
jgi:hypothetical protein